MGPASFFRRFSLSRVGFGACVLVFAGILLGITVHVVFFALFALGAFGPGLLRELGWLHDLDDLQFEASVHAGHRAYLLGGAFLTVVLIARKWGRMGLGDDFVPASLVLCLLVVVFVLAYGLSFWDVRQAATLVLLGFGLFWAAFVVLSHGNEPAAMAVEGAAVILPFAAGAYLCRRWPRIAGLFILIVAGFLVYLFRLYHVRASEQMFRQLFVAFLIPLPLAAVGVALLLPARRQ